MHHSGPWGLGLCGEEGGSEASTVTQLPWLWGNRTRRGRPELTLPLASWVAVSSIPPFSGP